MLLKTDNLTYTLTIPVKVRKISMKHLCCTYKKVQKEQVNFLLKCMWNPLVGSDKSNEVIFLIDIGID